MRKYFKLLSALILIPLTRWYLRKKRKYTYRGVKVDIFPGVFHPGLFSSTKFILNYLISQNLKEKTLLELGCGSGLISIVAAKHSAVVTASDLSSLAMFNTRANVKLNNVSIEVVQSDLFDDLKKIPFDWIVINPPYYARSPKTEPDLAWFCGENFEYFEKLFRQLPHYITASTRIIMVLTKGCELQKIFEIGKRYGFQFNQIDEKRVLFDEKNFLYGIVLHH